MCTCPVTVRNVGFNRLGGTEFIQVPCRKCLECQDVIAIDYLVRSLAIYTTLPPGWSVWFCTFTYNSECLPIADVYHVTDSKLHRWEKIESSVPCFNHSHIQLFMKSFKQYYRRLGLDSPKMMFTCEFGKQHGRPHYHGIVFVPRVFGSWQDFRNEVLRFWHYGFVKNIEMKCVDGCVSMREAINSFKYVVKYAAKGSDFPYYLNDDSLCLNVPREKYVPRVFMSNGYGSSLEDCLGDINYRENQVTFSLQGKFLTYKLPAYFRRRYYTRSCVLSKEKKWRVLPPSPAFPYGKCDKVWRYVTETCYKNDYESVRFDSFVRNIQNSVRSAVLNGLVNTSVSPEQYSNYCVNHYYRHPSDFRSRVPLLYKWFLEDNPYCRVSYDRCSSLLDGSVEPDLIENVPFSIRPPEIFGYTKVLDYPYFLCRKLESELGYIKANSLISRARRRRYKEIASENWYNLHCFS